MNMEHEQDGNLFEGLWNAFRICFIVAVCVFIVFRFCGCASNGRAVIGPWTGAHAYATTDHQTYTLPSGETVDAVSSSSQGFTFGYVASLLGDMATYAYAGKLAKDNNLFGMFKSSDSSSTASQAADTPVNQTTTSKSAGDNNVTIVVKENAAPVNITLTTQKNSTGVRH